MFSQFRRIEELRCPNVFEFLTQKNRTSEGWEEDSHSLTAFGARRNHTEI